MTKKRNEESTVDEVTPSPWRTLFRFADPFRIRSLVIILLVALSTTATLIEPLIYRVAVTTADLLLRLYEGDSGAF